jgi:lysophospholipase L1-like esterase
VVALGANDVGSPVQEEYAALLSHLKKRAPAVYAVAVTPLDGVEAINSQIVAAAKSADVPVIETHIAKAMLTDGIHPNPEGSRGWTAAVVAAIPGGPRSFRPYYPLVLLQPALACSSDWGKRKMARDS